MAVTFPTSTPGVGVRFGSDGAQSVQTSITGSSILDRAISNNNSGRSRRRSSGGGQSTVSAAELQASIDNSRKMAEMKAAADALVAEAEKRKILEQKTALIRQGRHPQVRILRDAATGNQIRQEIIKTQNQRNRVIINTNLTTGEKTYMSFTPQGSSSVRERGGSNVTAARVEPSTIPGKVVLRTATGEILLVNSKGIVNVSANIAGEKLTIRDGVIIRDRNYVPTKYVGEVTSVQKQGGLTGLQTSINRARGSISQKGSRASQSEQAKLLGFAFLAGVVDTVQGVIDTPKTLAYLARNPSEIRNIPSQIAQAGEQFGYILTTNPGEGLAYLGGSYVGIKGTNFALKTLSNTSGRLITRLNPKFIGKAVVGKTLNIKVGNRKTVKVKVVNKIPKQTLERQVALAGRKVNAISSQGDSLVGFLNKYKGKIIRKPIPGEAKFNVRTKNLLKKFDKGKITRTEFRELDSLIKQQGAKGLLERSFFADPSGKIRPSRLGVVSDKKLKLVDYLSEDITFKKPKPQILLFDDVKVASFPKSLRTVAKKLKSNKALSTREANALLEWQLRKSGKFKPVGFTTAESEIILSPGELLRKVRKVGITEIKGKRIPIIKVEVYRPSGVIKNLLNKYARGTITRAEELKLNRALKVKTGFNYGVSSSPIARARYVSIKRLGLQGLSGLRTSSRIKSRTSFGRRTSRLSSVSRVSRGKTSRGTSRKGTSRTSRTGTSRAVSGGSSRAVRFGTSRYGSSKGMSRVSPRKAVGKRVLVPKNFSSKTLPRKVNTYYVVEKIRGKYKKLYPKPLTAGDARDFAVYSIDNRLSKTAFLIPLGKAKKVIRPPKNIQGYYSKNSRKVRPYRIRYGAKKQLVNGYIEKRKYFQDTRGERLAAARLRAPSGKRVIKRQVKRRISTQQRKQMLRNLAKARARTSRGTSRRTPQRVMRRPVRQMRSRSISGSQRQELLRRLAKARAVRMRNLRRRR